MSARRRSASVVFTQSNKCGPVSRRSRCLFELDKKEAARRAQNASIYCVISHGMANYGVNTFSHLSPGPKQNARALDLTSLFRQSEKTLQMWMLWLNIYPHPGARRL